MPKYLRADGTETTADDPDRLVWYAAGGSFCWTDDWDWLDKTKDGIPCCPNCRALGFQGPVTSFLGQSLEEFEKQHPGYKKFTLSNKSVCRWSGMSWQEALAKFLAERNSNDLLA